MVRGVARDYAIERAILERQFLRGRNASLDGTMTTRRRFVSDDVQHVLGRIAGRHTRRTTARQREAGMPGAAAEIQNSRELELGRNGGQAVEVRARRMHRTRQVICRTIAELLHAQLMLIHDFFPWLDRRAILAPRPLPYTEIYSAIAEGRSP